MDSELKRRKPVERPQGKVVGAAVVDSKLFCEIIQREEGMTGIEAFLVFSVTALYLTVVPERVGADQLVTDPQLGSSRLKQGGEISLAVGETVGKLKAIVGLDTFDLNTPAGIPFE